ncbi:Uncharacterised protein [Canicola haemoglobinophilus]|uniref:Uncharacterized protein n=1 Tax=Canicola haemoglobinophilus TaxID=733 RepID=A0AB38H8A3_9PAST|nr:hypothetical protein [Canicola haemoglobinophilus]STO53823.1 Uncharacterised protein [Canicola haemoglobinophilus]STO68356.1 Uncharacterised protein [Canicola haemoglobinophilus]
MAWEFDGNDWTSSSSSNGYDSSGEKDTNSLNNLAMAIHNGSYGGKDDPRWSRSEDGYSSFGGESGGSSYGDNYASFGSGFNTKQTIRGAIQNHRSLSGAPTQSNPKATTLTGENVDGNLLASYTSKNRPDPRVFNDHHSQAAREFQNKYGFTEPSELEGFKKDSYSNRAVAGWDKNTRTTIDVDVNKSFLGTGHSFADRGKNEQDRHVTSYLDNIDEKVDSKRIGNFSVDDYRTGFIKGELTRANNLGKETLLNGFSNAVASPMANKISIAVFNAVGGGSTGILGGMLAGAGVQAGISSATEKLSHLGNNPSADVSALDKASFRHGYEDLRRNLDERRSSLGNFAHNAAVTAAAVGSQSPFIATGIDAGINVLRDDLNLKEYFSRHQNIPEYGNYLKEKEEKIAKAVAEDAERRKLDGSGREDKGILNSMSKRLKPAKEPQQPTLPYYAIPALTNLWNNVIIK